MRDKETCLGARHRPMYPNSVEHSLHFPKRPIKAQQSDCRSLVVPFEDLVQCDRDILVLVGRPENKRRR